MQAFHPRSALLVNSPDSNQNFISGTGANSKFCKIRQIYNESKHFVFNANFRKTT